MELIVVVAVTDSTWIRVPGEVLEPRRLCGEYRKVVPIIITHILLWTETIYIARCGVVEILPVETLRIPKYVDVLANTGIR